MKKKVDPIVREYFSELGKLGGGAQTKAQIEAWKINCKKGGAKKGNQNWKGTHERTNRKDA